MPANSRWDLIRGLKGQTNTVNGMVERQSNKAQPQGKC